MGEEEDRLMNLNEIIKESDMILVGIGEVFQDNFESVTVKDEKNVTIFEEYARKKYIEEMSEDFVIQAYNKLAELLEGKNYFIVTLCNDDKIYLSNLRKDRIVAPCGTYSVLQCEDVCSNEYYPVEDYEEMIQNGVEPLCPKCGKKLIMNHFGCPKYSEEWYLGQWNLYTKWLQGTLNRNLCILEFGVGMKYPSVVRWPFEKVAFINQKAKFVRVHESLYQLTQELKEKGVSIQNNPIDFLRNQIV